jgi:hypothetical protein
MQKRIKLTIWLLGIFLPAVIIHNILLSYFKRDDAVFFFIALVSAVGFGIALVYNMIIFMEELLGLKKGEVQLAGKSPVIKKKK